jgi:tetratricopeptide (TPR) repeat protein
MRVALVSLSSLLVSVFLTAAPDPEKLLGEGQAAFARGDYAEAAVLYEQAEIHSTDPAKVAFYLAGAKYHLALKAEGISAELLEAEQLYRCCLNFDDPRRPRALYGLGNCLLRKESERDATNLRTAVTCYDQCIRSAGDDEELKADARYNRERARLMLLQFIPPAAGSSSDKPPNDDDNPHPPQPDQRHLRPMQAGQEGNDGSDDSNSGANAAKPEPGTNAAKSDHPPPPGKGNLDPIPDRVDAPPLSPHEATEHLELAAKKVLMERETHHRRVERASATGVKDW